MTARYWRMTKPVPLADNAALDVLETEDDTGDDLDEPVEPATTSGPTADGAPPGSEPGQDTAATSPVPPSLPSVEDASAPGRSVFADPR